jgi:hypothetical protein
MEGDKGLLGDKIAKDVMVFWKGNRYRLLYRTVLDSEDVVGRVARVDVLFVALI